MTYRQIALIAKCSPGAVGAELRAAKSERFNVAIIKSETVLHHTDVASLPKESKESTAEKFEIVRF